MELWKKLTTNSIPLIATVLDYFAVQQPLVYVVLATLIGTGILAVNGLVDAGIAVPENVRFITTMLGSFSLGIMKPRTQANKKKLEPSKE